MKNLELKSELYGSDLYLSYMKRRYLSHAVQEFIKNCESYFSEEI